MADVPTPADLDAIRARYPEVAPFVESMYRELAANSHKGDQAGWLLMTLRQAWQEISWHTAKLAVAIKSNDEPSIREYAADVANGCMMLVDILNHGEVDRCRCGWPTTVANPSCAWHEMREAKGEVPAPEVAELCLICGETGPVNFECGHPDAHTPVANSHHDANGEPWDA